MSGHTFQFKLGDAGTTAIADALKVVGATVSLVVPASGPSSFTLLLPRPAQDVTLEFRWQDGARRSRPGFVQLQRLGRWGTAGSLVRFEAIPIGEAGPAVIIKDALSCRKACVTDASLRAEESGISVHQLQVDRGREVEGVHLSGLVVAVRHGSFHGSGDGGSVSVQRTHDVELSRRQGDPRVEICDWIQDARFDDVRVAVMPNARIEGCTGSIRLLRCVEATIEGRRGRPLDLEAVFELRDDSALGPLDGAVIRNVRIAPTSVRAIVAASSTVRVLDPAPDSVVDSLAAIDREDQTSVAELLHDRISDKAKRQETVDAAAMAVLDMRRRNARRFGTEWALLTGHWALGYGRRIARPLAVWATIVVLVLGFRIEHAARAPSGYLAVGHGIHFRSPERAVVAAGNIVLTVALLPLSWNKGVDDHVEQRVGLSGGYLMALRVAMIVPLVAAASAIRRRVRVRPYNDVK